MKGWTEWQDVERGEGMSIDYTHVKAQFNGQRYGPNVGDSKIYASDRDELLFEAKQISFDLHHQIEQSIRKAERLKAEITRQQIVREIEMRTNQ